MAGVEDAADGSRISPIASDPHSSHMTIRPYRDGDECELVRLFEKTYGRRITEAHWRWKLKRQPSPVHNVWLAVSGDRPIAQHAGIPTKFWLAGTQVTTIVGVDRMTAPEFRRQGLMTEVVRQALANWREGGIAFLIGLPNEQWEKRRRAFGWQSLFPLQWMVRPLRPEAILARRLRIPLLNRATAVAALWNRVLKGRLKRDPDVQIEQVRNAGEEFDQIWESCKSDAMFSTVRDAAWVNWRFLSSPSGEYQLVLARRAGKAVGYAAYRLARTEQKTSAYLAEIVTARTDSGCRDTLLDDLIDKLRAADAETLVALAVPGTLTFRWLCGAGFFLGHAFSVQLAPLSPELPIDQMRDPENWSITGADFDVV
jgi:hypothetical protein